MKKRLFPFQSGRRDGGFSLVEVALALGVVGFALVGIVGALPVAMNNERLSIAQTRAASVASTLFANIRTQSFSKVQFLDDAATATTPSGIGAVNLNVMVTTQKDPPTGYPGTVDINSPIKFFAYFDESLSSAATGDARRLHFSAAAPAGGPCYQIVLRFDNNPVGTLTPYVSKPNSNVLRAQANGIEASIVELDRPRDVFRFNSVIANRLD